MDHRTKKLLSLINLFVALGSVVLTMLTLGFRVLPPIFLLIVIPFASTSLLWHIRIVSENWQANAKKR